MKTLLSFLFAIGLTSPAWTQKQEKQARGFGDPFLTDTLSTVFLPTEYTTLLSPDIKLFFGSYYANLFAYNFVTDSYHSIFPNDVYIEAFKRRTDLPATAAVRYENITRQWVLFLAKTDDYNGNGRIDETDPSVLYAVSPQGEGLQAVTPETENAVSFRVFEQEGFILVKMQRDLVKDRSFRNEDKDFYYLKVSLTDLKTGKPVEMR